MNMHPKYARLVRRSPEHPNTRSFRFAMPRISRRKLFFVVLVALIVSLVSAVIFVVSSPSNIKKVIADGYHYQYKNDKSSFDSISFAKSNKLLPSYRIKDDDVSLAMTYSPTRIKDSYTVISGSWGARDSLTFKDVEKNTNIIYTLEGKNTVKEDIELTKRPTKESLSFYKFTIELTGLTYERDKNGTIIPVFFDKKGAEYSIPPLVMKDASGKESNLVTLTLSAPDPKFPNMLTAIVMPDVQWLTDQARKYPVRIDPTVVRGDAPVAYWKFDEGTGTTAHDSAWRSTNTTTNLEINPSLETNMTGWSGWDNSGSATRSVSTEQAAFGTSSFKQVVTASGNQEGDSYGANIQEGHTYTVSFWVNATVMGSGEAIPFYYRVFHDTNNYILGTIATVSAVTNGWVRYSMTQTIPVNGYTGTNIQLSFYTNVIGTVIYVDGVQIEEASTATNYCDGSLTGSGTYTWNGTAHGSSSTCNLITHGTISGPTWQTEDQCISGKCVYQDGTSNKYSSIASNITSGWTANNDFTVNLWFNCKGEGYSAPPYSYLAGLFIHGTSAEGGTGGFYLRQLSTSCASMQFNVSTTTASNAITANLSSGQNNWSHIVAVKSGDTLSVYENGVQKASQTFTGAIWNVNVDQQTVIGSVHGRSVKGSIDDVKVYSYARTATQIKADYNAKGSASAIGSTAILGKSTANNDAFSNGLVGYWKLDESASPAVDSSGNGNSGTWVGTTAAASGKYGNGAVFDGDSDYIEMADTPSLSPGGAFTFSTWIYQTAACTGDCIIFNKESEYEWRVVNGSVDYAIANTSPGWTWVSTGVTISPNTWTLVTMTYDSTAQEIKAYKNGELTSTRPNSTGSLGDAGQTLRLAARSGPGSFFGGRLDETRIYNRALSPQEVRDLYSWAPGPVAYYTFDEGSGSTINDKSGNGFNSTSLSGTPHWDLGKIGKSMYFDGSTNSIILPAGIFANKPQKITFEIWLKGKDQPTNTSLFAAHPSQKVNVHGPWGDTNMYWDYGEACCNARIYKAMPSNYMNDNWTHFAFTADMDTHLMQIYANGVLWHSGSVSANTMVNAPTSFDLGSYDGTNYKYKGWMDEFKIYDYVRTAKQITEDMQGSQPVVSAGSSGGAPAGAPVGYWKFDEGYGTTVKDSSSNSNHGTSFVGTPTWNNNGKFGKAINFNGTDVAGDYVSIPYSSSLNIFASTNWSVSMWVKPLGGCPSTCTVINGVGHVPRLSVDNSSVVLQGMVGGNFTTILSASGINANQWNHVVYWANGTTNKIYINGVEKGSATYQQLDSPFTELHIGASGWGSEDYQGDIDEVKFYNSALTEDEVRLEYNHGSALVLGDSSLNSIGSSSGSTGTSCLDILNKNPKASDGSYWITPTGSTTAIQVYCDMTTDGGGWTRGMSKIAGDTSTCNTANLWSTIETITQNWGSGGEIMSKYFNVSQISPNASPLSVVKFTQGPYSSIYTMFSFPKTSDGWTYEGVGSFNLKIVAGSNYSNTMWWDWGGSLDRKADYCIGGPPYHHACIFEGTAHGVCGYIYHDGVWSNTSQAQELYVRETTPNQSTSGLVGEWKFEEGTGTSANDTSGNGITGALNSSPSWVPGKIGKGLTFSGSNNVTLGAAKYDTLTNATFETWFNYTGGFDDNYVIVQRYKDGSNRQPVFVSFSGGYGNKVVFENIVGGSNRGITSDSTIAANTWYHLAATCGSGGMKMYLNGQVQASTNATTDCFSSIAATTETYIGQNFKGTLDQTTIYNYARTPAQIAYDYNRGKPVAYYKLDECTGATVHSTNETYNSGLNGTVTIGGGGSQTSVGTCTTSSTAWGNGATGKVNSSLNFDGTDDRAINNSGGFLPTGDTPRTIAFWFKPQSGMSDANGAFGYGCSEEGYGCTSAGVGTYVSAWANTSNIGLHLETCQITGPSTPSPTTGWHLYTAVFNGNNTISFYIDGVGPTTVTPGCTINTSAGKGWSIGVARWGYYNGQIDEVQVYNYALSPEQIKAVYNNGAVSFK